MKVLVSGGAGFIGSHTVDFLIKQGAEVVIVDDLSRGKKENINPAANFYPIDIRSRDIKDLLAGEPVEYAIHLAAQIDVQSSLKEPLFDASVNILGTLNLLEACLQSGVKKVVYASSAAVYGEPCYLPVDEKHPVKSQSGYGLSKQVAERYLALYKALHGLDFSVLRYANVYGPRQDAAGEGGVVAVFADKLLKGDVPEIFGDGEQTRDFVFAADVARANFLALQKAPGACMNVSTGEETTVNHLYRTFQDLLGEEREPRYARARPGDINKSFLANHLIKEILNWEPEVTLKEGLRLTLEYQRERIQQAGAMKKIG